jgi:glutamate 5-kinase
MKKKRLVVKIGTNAITNPDASLNHELIREVVAQLAQLRESHDIVLVSSGAMGCGRSILKDREMRYDETTSRQLYAVVGQVKLMDTYADLFKEHGIIIAQMLATRQDFENRTHHLNTKNCLESLFREDIIPVVNENDFVCVEELMFSDNDELAGILSKMLFVDRLIILSNVDGVYDEDGEVMEEFNFDAEVPPSIVSGDKSSFGKGGMQNKFKIAATVARHGTEVHIANSKADDVVLSLVRGEAVGTRFIPKKDH